MQDLRGRFRRWSAAPRRRRLLRIGLGLAAGLVLAAALSPGSARWLRAGQPDRPPRPALGRSATTPPAPALPPDPAPPPREEPRQLAARDAGPPQAVAHDWASEELAPPEDDASFDCIIEPSIVASIGSPVEGVIEKLHVERSDLVEAGQVLVELESGVERAQVKLARARSQMRGAVEAREASLSLEQRRRGRVSQLFEEQALSLDVREQADTEAEIARLQLVEAQENQQLASLQLQQALEILRRRTIHSPGSGVVIDRLMSPGEVVDDDETILQVAQIDPLRVEVILPAAMFGTVRTGMRAAVEPEFPGDSVHVAKVQLVDRVIDAASGTFGVRLELPNPDHAIPGGLNCQVRFLDE
jgi:RND family efflux transporter MFP subunit